MSEVTDRRVRFEALFHRHCGDVRAYALRRAPATADDAVAETFLVAWRRLDEIGEDPLPWLYGVARRVLANQHRGERRRVALRERLTREPGAATAPPAVPEGHSDLADALSTLTAREREALLLVAWEGLTPERAARAAGCSPATFRVRLHRGRRKLAARLRASGHHLSPVPTLEEPR